MVEAATFLAILLGLVAGALAADKTLAPGTIVVQLMLVAAAAYATSLFIPRKSAAAPDLPVHRNILASTVELVRELQAEPKLWRPGLAVSWFWLTGAVALSLVPVAVRNATGRRHRRRGCHQRLFRLRHWCGVDCSSTPRKRPYQPRPGASGRHRHGCLSPSLGLVHAWPSGATHRRHKSR